MEDIDVEVFLALIFCIIWLSVTEKLVIPESGELRDLSDWLSRVSELLLAISIGEDAGTCMGWEVICLPCTMEDTMGRWIRCPCDPEPVIRTVCCWSEDNKFPFESLKLSMLEVVMRPFESRTIIPMLREFCCDVENTAWCLLLSIRELEMLQGFPLEVLRIFKRLFFGNQWGEKKSISDRYFVLYIIKHHQCNYSLLLSKIINLICVS